MRARLGFCDAKFGALNFYTEGAFHSGALHNAPPAFAAFMRRGPVRPGPSVPLGRMERTKQVIHVADIRTEPSYIDGEPLAVAGADLGGYRTILLVPMLQEEELVGAIVIFRQEVRPFSDKQIELLQNFAAQAVIAIENTRLLNELRQRTDDLSEALEQQTATSEVLGIISSSPGELTPVFRTILENATRICDAKFATLFRYDGEMFHRVAGTGTPPAFVEFQIQRGPFKPEASPRFSRMMRTKAVEHTADELAEPIPGPPATLGGARSVVSVPMLKDNALVGAIIIYRQEVRPFTAKQIELVQNFAAQAVIAIENTRLLSELRQRTDDLSEALEQQTATSEVLQVISNSPGDLEPVFKAMLEQAARVCEAQNGILFRFDHGVVRPEATLNMPAELVEFMSRGQRPGPDSPMRMLFDTKQTVHVPDVLSSPAYLAGDPMVQAGVKFAGMRTLLVVPMLKEGELIGLIGMLRQEVRPFTDKQIELVKNFAAQAVIAVENTRLLAELRQRTDDLTESLEQQTATAEVLKVISTSPGDLEPVFRIMLEKATRICDAKFGVMFRFDEDLSYAVATLNLPSGVDEFFRQRGRLKPTPGSDLDKVWQTKQASHTIDMSDSPNPSRIAKIAGVRTQLAVPMLMDDDLVGAIMIYRQEVRPFTDKQIELVQNFAAQAVIAIENTRLLNELRELLQQQTATSNVLEVISRSAFDLQPVFDTVAESCVKLCGADRAFIFRFDGELLQMVASFNSAPEFVEWVRRNPIRPGRHSGSARAALERRTIHIPDVRADPEYSYGAKSVEAIRTILGVPILKGDQLLGVMMIYRLEVRPFSDKQIALVETFADQAAIAIENVRLFDSVEDRTRELAASLEDLRTAQDRLVQTEKLASLGQLTAGIAHEIKNPLNFVNNFSAVSVELIDELREALSIAHLDSKLRAEITEIADMLQGNLDKVVQHGKRADSIVKNMLMHSREGSGEHRFVDINAIVEESLNLAYHGARAEKQGFNITLGRSFDPAAGQVDLYPQEITRVLLNLISNGFYAATKRKGQTTNESYEPTLAAATKDLGDRVEIRIRDNGTGIPPEVMAKMFNPFFTTKPAGEGTGLGLSISHDIIVKQHGGAIEVDTKPGEFTEFRIILPRAAASLAKSGGRP